MEVLIRNAKKEEAALLAQIEAECFPAVGGSRQAGY